MQNTLNTHIIFKKESVQIGYSLFEQSKMDKMKKNKFDARFLNKIVTIFSIIFIVILVMATLFHCLYDCLLYTSLCACKFKMFKGYASQSHFIGLALQCFTCLCSCVVVPRVVLERLPKGRWGIPHETLLQIHYQLR